MLPEANNLDDEGYGQRRIRTTLEGDLQRAAVRAVRRAGLGRTQAALVAMRLDGRVVAMVGGRDYAQSVFNRATQARRQPGSAFKVFVYLAAFRAGYRPDTMVNDAPIRLGDWRPRNYGDSYRGMIPLRDAVAFSSNSVAVQLSERVGRDNVIRAARDLGITTPLRPAPSLPLGVNGVSLLELTSAYAGIASGRFPIRPYGIPGDAPSESSMRRDPSICATCAKCSTASSGAAPAGRRTFPCRPSARPAPRPTIATPCSSASPATWSSASGSAMTTTARCPARPAAARRRGSGAPS